LIRHIFETEKWTTASPFCFVENMDRTIETQRLLLRPLRAGDAAAIAHQINTEKITHNLARVPFPYGLADAEEFLSWALPQQEKTRFSAICLKDDPETLRGCISYDRLSDKNSVELGYWLAVPLWGRGLMSEAVAAMTIDAFEVARVDLIAASYFVENPASGALLRKAGFEEIGPCKIYCCSRDAEVDAVSLQLTKEKAATS
jgi:RimJ/RimL family protein N-acetyltransferase